MNDECQLCGETDCDLVTCVQCGKRVCSECSTWGCDDDDEACGDWFCEDCIEMNARATGGGT